MKNFHILSLLFCFGTVLPSCSKDNSESEDITGNWTVVE